MTVFCTWLSSQLISTPPRMPLPQLVVPVAQSAVGTLIVTGLSVFRDSVTPNLGLIPVGLANFQNSARWKALVTCVVPIETPPNLVSLVLTIGEFCVRASGLAPGS